MNQAIENDNDFFKKDYENHVKNCLKKSIQPLSPDELMQASHSLLYGDLILNPVNSLLNRFRTNIFLKEKNISKEIPIEKIKPFEYKTKEQEAIFSLFQNIMKDNNICIQGYSVMIEYNRMKGKYE